MENKILYGVGQGFSELGKIVEFLVVKETPKTFVVKEKVSVSFCNWERHVKKSQMTVGNIYSYKLVETYPEAIELAKHFIRRRIENNILGIENKKRKTYNFPKNLKNWRATNERT